MKRLVATSLLITAGILLQGCAGSVNSQGHGTRKLLTGSKQLSLSSKQCPYGIGVIRLYKDTLDGNKTRFNTKMAITSEPITEDFNIYNLLDENHPDLGGGSAPKVKLDTKYNSIQIKLSNKVLAEAPGRVSNAKMLTNPDEGQKAAVDEEISIRLNPKKNDYENWGEVSNGVLSEADLGEANKEVIHSVYVKFGKDFMGLPLPSTIDAGDSALESVIDATIGTELPLALKAKESSTPGIVYIQFTNGAKGKDNYTANFIVDEPADGIVKIPTSEIAKGEYIMNIFRSEVFPININTGTEGGAKTMCIEVATGAMSRLAASEPEKK